MKLAVDAIREGGYKPAVLNAANEIAVERFLNEEIPYIGISNIIETCLERLHSQAELTTQTLKEIDQEARELALTI
jgi:1-deoxy-D-xylulose-5-phosphate reductoisomerase